MHKLVPNGKRLVVFLVFLCAGIPWGYGQYGPIPSDTTTQVDSAADSPKKKRSTRPDRIPADDTTFLNHFGLGISGGTKNFLGADLVINIISNLNVRFGYNQFDLEFDDVETSVSGFTNQNLTFDGRIQQNNIEVLFEWGILKNRIRFVAGPVFAMDNQISSDFAFTEDIQINDITIPAQEVGSGNVQVSHSFGVFPYVGIGIGRGLPWRRVGISMDIGTYYKGTTRVDLAATGLIRANENNESVLNQNLRREPVASLWPIVSLRLAYRIF